MTNPLKLRKKKDTPDWDEVSHVKITAVPQGFRMRCTICNKASRVGPPALPQHYWKAVEDFFKVHQGCAKIEKYEASK